MTDSRLDGKVDYTAKSVIADKLVARMGLQSQDFNKRGRFLLCHGRGVLLSPSLCSLPFLTIERCAPCGRIIIRFMSSLPISRDVRCAADEGQIVRANIADHFSVRGYNLMFDLIIC